MQGDKRHTRLYWEYSWAVLEPFFLLFTLQGSSSLGLASKCMVPRQAARHDRILCHDLSLKPQTLPNFKDSITPRCL